MKTIGLFKIECSVLINFFLNKFQSVVATLVTLVAGTGMYIYKDKHSDSLDHKLLKDSIVSIPNHVSEVDSLYVGPLFATVYPQNYQLVIFVKHTTRFIPFLGGILLATNAIFVQNKNKIPNPTQYNYIKNKLKKSDKICAKRNILIFIEGTTYTKSVKKRRDDYAKIMNFPIYKNLMLPKTTGLHMIESNSDIKDEYYVSMKYVDENGMSDLNDADKYDIFGLLKGNKPKEVHMFIEKKILDRDLLEDREKFNKRVYDNFKIVDGRLSEDINKWSTDYKKEKVKITIGGAIWSLFFSLCGIFTMYMMWTSKFYQIFTVIALSFYYFMAFLEHKDYFIYKKVKY
jgi:1-acyl-sn-glycerol-3-phosphate acyltransferase